MKMNLLNFNKISKLIVILIIVLFFSCGNNRQNYEFSDYIEVSLNENFNRNNTSEHTIYLPNGYTLDSFYVSKGIRMSDRFVYCYHKTDSVTNDTIVYRKYRQTDGKPFLIVKIIQIK